jgi:HK97 family phage major capsid protein
MSKSFVLGGTVKAAPDGKISGWLVRFSDGSNHDLQGEYFTKSTDFGHLEDVNVLYHHGLDETIKLNLAVPGSIKKFDEGIWIDSQLDLSDRYQNAVMKLINKGALGWSAGTAPHLVETVKKENGAHEIKRFPLGLDASLTPTPAEPTTVPKILDMVTMKSLATTGIAELLEDGGTVKSSIAVDNLVIKTERVTVMPVEQEQETPEQEQETPEQAKEQEHEQALKAANALIKEQGEALKGVTDILERAGKLKDMGYLAPDSEGNDNHNSTKSLGDFLIAVANKNLKRLDKVYGIKAQIEASGPDGGYLVPEEFIPQIYEAMKEQSGIVSRVSMQTVSAPTGKYPALDQYFTPTAGVGQSAFNAGLDGQARAEGGTYTEDDIDFTMIEWLVNDAVSGIIKVSRELSQDAPLIEGLLTRMIAQVQQTKTEFFILRGTGVNQPTGILNSAALINITPATNDVFAYADALTMLSRFKNVGGQTAWLMHPSVVPDVGVMESSAGGGVFQANFGTALGSTLLGFPIVLSEHLPQANNSGNVLLTDLSAYVLFNLGGVYVDFSEHAYFTSGYNAWRFGHRMDGKVQFKNAITLADPQGSYTVSPFVNHND